MSITLRSSASIDPNLAAAAARCRANVPVDPSIALDKQQLGTDDEGIECLRLDPSLSRRRRFIGRFG
jgi:hypothetical protein